MTDNASRSLLLRIHALNARSKDQRNHCVEMLRLLLNAPGHSSPEPTPIDPPPDEPPEEPP